MAKARAAAEAANAEAFSRATARRRLATGAAIGIAAVGVGLGLYLGLWKPDAKAPAQQAAVRPAPVEPVRPVAEPARTPPEPAPSPPAPPAETAVAPAGSPKPAPAPGVVTVDFTKFASVTVGFLGRDWEIEAGHHYAVETDKTWNNAWCYTNADAKGVSVRVSLAFRDGPEVRPVALLASPETLKETGLDDVAALALATKCPWLDGKTFGPSDFATPPDRTSPLTAEDATFRLEGRTLVASGFIGESFASQLRGYDFDRLRITSAGGIVEQGIEAGEWLRAWNKTVEASGECLSSCVFVLAGGARRLASADTHIGVHRFYSTGGPDPRDLEIGQALSSRILRYFGEGGIDAALFHKMASVPSEDMAYIDHRTLLAWRLLTGAPGEVAALDPAIDIGNLPQPPGSFTTLVALDAMGADLPDMPVRDVTQAGCEELCRENEVCGAYVFNTRYNACFLKSSANVLIRDPIAVTGYRADRGIRPMVSALRISLGTAIRGFELAPGRQRSYVDCVRICDGSPECRAFTHNATTSMCTLYRQVTGTLPAPQLSSGVKEGPG